MAGATRRPKAGCQPRSPINPCEEGPPREGWGDAPPTARRQAVSPVRSLNGGPGRRARGRAASSYGYRLGGTEAPRRAHPQGPDVADAPWNAARKAGATRLRAGRLASVGISPLRSRNTGGEGQATHPRASRRARTQRQLRPGAPTGVMPPKLMTGVPLRAGGGLDVL